jgi:hypothetical protein
MIRDVPWYWLLWVIGGEVGRADYGIAILRFHSDPPKKVGERIQCGASMCMASDRFTVAGEETQVDTSHSSVMLLLCTTAARSGMFRGGSTVTITSNIWRPGYSVAVGGLDARSLESARTQHFGGHAEKKVSLK